MYTNNFELKMMDMFGSVTLRYQYVNNFKTIIRNNARYCYKCHLSQTPLKHIPLGFDLLLSYH